MDPIKKAPKLRVPVRYANSRWEFFYGGEVPVLDNTIGDLVINQASVRDKTFLQTLTRKTQHKVLDQGVQLLIALTIKDEPILPDALKKYLRNVPLDKLAPSVQKWPSTLFIFVTVGEPAPSGKSKEAKGGVWLCLQGLEATGLVTTADIIAPPEVSKTPLLSLNHAFTRLSEVYEPWRISHTGNIYDRILYQEPNGRWYPLGDLREAQLAGAERQVVAALWKRVADSIGMPGYDPTKPLKS